MYERTLFNRRLAPSRALSLAYSRIISRSRSLNIKPISPSPDSSVYEFFFFDRGQEEDYYYGFS